MWIELKIVISYPKNLKMSTSIDPEFLARATIALVAPRPMLDHQQKFLQISAALMLLCSSLVQPRPKGEIVLITGASDVGGVERSTNGRSLTQLN